MKKIIILIPIYNDWESLSKLLNDINQEIENINDFEFNCIIVNDNSTIEKSNFSKPHNIKTLKIINMKNNKGHARCNAFGLRYINLNENFDYVIVMDGDGEDRPQELKDLTNKIKEDTEKSVVAKRIKRSEGVIFQLMYKGHKLITLLTTGKKIDFGNYSCLTKKDVIILSDKASLWSSFSGSLKKYISNYNEISSIRGRRYFGPSKMSLFNLFLHSFSIIAVFKYSVLLRSVIFLSLLFFFKAKFLIFSSSLQLIIILFCILIFLVSLRENRKELLNSQENLKNIEDILH